MSSEVLFTPVAEMAGWRINGERLWDSLMALAEIGATPKGGCCRLTLTDLDRHKGLLFAAQGTRTQVFGHLAGQFTQEVLVAQAVEVGIGHQR